MIILIATKMHSAMAQCVCKLVITVKGSKISQRDLEQHVRDFDVISARAFVSFDFLQFQSEL